MRYRTVTGDDLVAELAGTRKPFVVDVRRQEDFLAGHVPGSVHVRVYDLGHERKRLPSSSVRRIVLVGEPGKRTEAGATFLTLMGYGDVAILEGGIDGWPGELEVGEPPERESGPGPQLRLLPRERMEGAQGPASSNPSDGPSTDDEPNSNPSGSSS